MGIISVINGKNSTFAVEPFFVCTWLSPDLISCVRMKVFMANRVKSCWKEIPSVLFIQTNILCLDCLQSNWTACSPFLSRSLCGGDTHRKIGTRRIVDQTRVASRPNPFSLILLFLLALADSNIRQI